MAAGGPGLAGAVLAPAGVHTLYGEAEAGLPVIECEEKVAGLMARAHRVVRRRPAGAVVAGVISIPGPTGDEPEVIDVDARTDAAGLARRIRTAARSGGVRLRLEVDPSAPWPAPAGSAGEAEPDPWLSDLDALVERIGGARRVIVLAGPGVVAAGEIPGLHAFAHALGAGVLNTWGAKGIFHWRSRYHWATVGLQEDDLRLAGVDGADLVIGVGVDGREVPERQWKHGPHLRLDPELLGPLAERLPPRAPDLDMPPLRVRLAAATQSGWGATGPPLPPSRVTLHYGQRLAGGGLVAADAGNSGFWVARTFATTELGMVAVPPYVDPGWAVAAVTVARLADPLRPALAVIDGELDDVARVVLDFGRSHGITVGVEAWTPGGEPLDAGTHDLRLARLLAPGGPGEVATVATDPDQLEQFVAAAGPVRDWRPPRRGA